MNIRNTIQCSLRYCMLWLACGFLAPAHAQADKYAVIEAEELADNPQRFWSRGIVVEDLLEKVTGSRERIGDRRFVAIDTSLLGRAYVQEPLAEELEPDTEYLFSGTVVSRTSRRWIFWSKTKYFIIFESAKVSLADTEEAVDLFLSGNSDRLAVQHVSDMVASAQKLLVAHAEEEGKRIEDLVDPEAYRTDKAAEVSRMAVRAIEQELGVTSSELMSLFVREILVRPYEEAKYEEQRNGEFEEDAEKILSQDEELIPEEDENLTEPEKEPSQDEEDVRHEDDEMETQPQENLDETVSENTVLENVEDEQEEALDPIPELSPASPVGR